MTILTGGVIGFGNIGQGLTRYINTNKQDEARIVAACNRGKPNLDIAKEKYGLAVTHDVRELVDMDLDFVLVVSTSYAHTEQVVAAAEAGLHVFCEKPIALTVEDADHDTKRRGGRMDHFLECIREGKQSPNSLRSARHSLVVALAMQESARLGKVVDVG